MAAEVKIIVSAEDRASTELSKVKDSIKGIEDVGKGMRKVGLALTAGVTLPLGALIVKSTMAAARVDELDIVIEQLGKSAGYADGELAGYVDAVRDMGIEAASSREIIAKFVTAQLDAADAAKIARIAQDQAVMSGENSTETTIRLTNALISGNSQMFRSMNMTLEFSDAYREMADTLGKSVNDLTEAEKVQARLNAVFEYGTTIQGTYEAAMNDSYKQMQSFKRYVDDIYIALGQNFTPALNEAVFALSPLLQAIPEMISEGGALSPILKEWGEDAKLAAQMFSGLVKGISELDPWVLQLTTKTLGLTAVMGPLFLVVGQGVIWYSKLAAAMKATSIAAGGLAGSLGVLVGLTYAVIEAKKAEAKARYDIIDSIKEEAEAAAAASSNYEEYKDNLGATTEQIENLAGVTGGYGIHLAEAMSSVVDMTYEQEKQAEAMAFGSEMAAGYAAMIEHMGEAIDALPEGAEVDIQIETEQAMAALQALQDKMEQDLSRAMEVLVNAQNNWKDNLANDLVKGLEDAGLEAGEFEERLGAIDRALGTELLREHKYQVEYDLQIDELLKTLLEDPQKFVNDAAVFVDYFMPLETSVRNAQAVVDELQADLDEIAKEYEAIINITTVGSIPELQDQSATYTIYYRSSGSGALEGFRAAGGEVQPSVPLPRAAGGYWVGEFGPEPFFPAQAGRIISNTQAMQAIRESDQGREQPIVVNINTPFNFADEVWVERELAPYIRKEIREVLR